MTKAQRPGGGSSGLIHDNDDDDNDKTRRENTNSNSNLYRVHPAAFGKKSVRTHAYVDFLIENEIISYMFLS